MLHILFQYDKIILFFKSKQTKKVTLIVNLNLRKTISLRMNRYNFCGCFVHWSLSRRRSRSAIDSSRLLRWYRFKCANKEVRSKLVCIAFYVHFNRLSNIKAKLRGACPFSSGSPTHRWRAFHAAIKYSVCTGSYTCDISFCNANITLISLHCLSARLYKMF